MQLSRIMVCFADGMRRGRRGWRMAEALWRRGSKDQSQVSSAQWMARKPVCRRPGIVRTRIARALSIGGLASGAAWFGGCGAADSQAPAAQCGATEGVVERVIDGDTVVMADGRRIRYLLIDTPEVSGTGGASESECFAEEAAERNRQLVAGERVTLEYDTQCEDRYGRTLAYVYRGETMVNRLLISGGYAELLVIEPNKRYANELAELEEQARDQGAGKWGSACQ